MYITLNYDSILHINSNDPHEQDIPKRSCEEPLEWVNRSTRIQEKRNAKQFERNNKICTNDVGTRQVDEANEKPRGSLMVRRQTMSDCLLVWCEVMMCDCGSSWTVKLIHPCCPLEEPFRCEQKAEVESYVESYAIAWMGSCLYLKLPVSSPIGSPSSRKTTTS